MRVSQRVFLVLTQALMGFHSEGKAHNLSEVFIETGYHLGRNWFVPDVSVTHSGQVERNAKYFESAPALAVEVISGSNTAKAMHRQVLRDFEDGAKKVWVSYPDTCSVTVYFGERSIEVRVTLTTDRFPGLCISLAEIFA